VRARASRHGIPAVLAGALLAVLASAAAASLPGTALAAGPAPSAVTVSAPDGAVIGQAITVRAQLTSGGVPVTSRLLTLLLDGVQLRTASVDANGTAEIPIRRDELAQAHRAVITVAYPGSPALAASSASVAVVVRPARVTVETVPASDNVAVTLGELKAVTRDGVASFDVARVGTYRLAMSVGDTVAPETRADFVRWGDNVYTPDRPLKVDGDVSLQLGLHVAYRGSFEFRDSHGQAVDPSTVESVTLTSTGGHELVLRQYRDVWLEAGMAVKRATGLDVSPRNWRVLEVAIAGTNVVNRGQQEVDPRPGMVTTVDVLLFDLSIEAHDALFGLPVAGNLELEYPDGTVQRATFDEERQVVEFARLPRGDYTLRLHARGIGAPTPVALSRDQEAVIRVISYLDIGVFAGFALVVLAALLWFGRRHQVLAVASGSRRAAGDLGMAGRSTVDAAGRLLRTASSSAPGRVRRALSRVALSPMAPPRTTLPGLSLRGPSVRAIASRAREWRAAPGRRTQRPDGVASFSTELASPVPAAPSLAEMVGATIDRRPMERSPAHTSRRQAPASDSSAGAAPSEPRRARRATGSSWWRPCPSCGRRVAPRAGYCPSCGATVET
jgi:hypothetical protein